MIETTLSDVLRTLLFIRIVYERVEDNLTFDPKDEPLSCIVGCRCYVMQSVKHEKSGIDSELESFNCFENASLKITTSKVIRNSLQFLQISQKPKEVKLLSYRHKVVNIIV